MSTTTRYQHSRQPLRKYLTTYANDDQVPDSRDLKPLDNYIGRHRADVMLLARPGVRHLPIGTRITSTKPHLFSQHLTALLDNDDDRIDETATSLRHNILDSWEPGGRRYRDAHRSRGRLSRLFLSVVIIFGVTYIAVSLPQELDNTLTSLFILASLATVLMATLLFIGTGIGWLMTYPAVRVDHRKAIEQFNEPIDATREILATPVEALDTTNAGHAGQRVRLLHSDLANLDLRVHERSEYSMYLAELHELWLNYEKLTEALVTFADTDTDDHHTREREDMLITEAAEGLIARCAHLNTLVGQTHTIEASDGITELAARRGAQEVQAINSQRAQDTLRAQLLDPAPAKNQPH